MIMFQKLLGCFMLDMLVKTTRFSDHFKFQPECFYRGFRDDEGYFTPVHWKILAVKFAFVIIFEHVVFGVCKLIDILVPDIPASLDIKIKRERYLAKEALQVTNIIFFNKTKYFRLRL